MGFRDLIKYLILTTFLIAPTVGITDIVFENKLRPFTTDACTLFPNGSPFSDSQRWRGCCVAHDLLYWKGGTKAEKITADQGLQNCVAEYGYPIIGDLMKWGVKIGGTPKINTTWKWGYGWVVNRGYNPLHPEQLTRVNQMTSNFPLDISKFEITKTVYDPRRDTITGDYCLDLVGQKIEDKLGRPVLIKNFEEKMSHHNKFVKTYVIQVEGCPLPFHARFDLVKAGSCLTPLTEMQFSRDIFLRSLKGPKPELCKVSSQD